MNKFLTKITTIIFATIVFFNVAISYAGVPIKSEVTGIADTSTIIDKIVDTNTIVSQLVMAVNNAINTTAFGLQTSAYSETTNITDDYILDNIEMKFSTTAARDIVVTTSNGVILFEDKDSIEKNLFLPSQGSFNLGFVANDNITIAITQTSTACDITVILRTRSGTNALVGNPATKWVDTGGTERGYQNIDGRPRISITPYETEISKGNIVNHVHSWGFGENDDIDTSVTGEDMWLGPSLTIPHPLVAGEQMTVVSSDADDTNGGTGTRTINFEYIDSAGTVQTEAVTMDGTLGVNTTATNIAFVNHIYSTTLGSTGVAEGDIEIHKLGDPATVYNLIAAGGNKSLSAILRIPANRTYFLTEWHASISGGKPTAVRLRSTDWNGITYNGDNPVFIFKDTAFIGEAAFDRIFAPPIRIPAGSTIKVTSWATQANTLGAASFNGYYETE